MAGKSLALAVGAAALLTAGCGASSRPSTPAPATSARSARSADPPARPVRAAALVRLVQTRFGRALVDRRGFALYLFTRDRSSASTCYGACATAWPPYHVAGQPLGAGPGLDKGLLGTVRRTDGTVQLTYAGHPLYHYVGDTRSGEVLCQGAEQFGGTWYVVAARGGAIH